MTCTPHTTYTHKRGDSLDLMVTIPTQFADGHFASWVPASQVRAADDALLADLVVAWVDPVTARTLRLTCIDTTAWPVGQAGLDVQLTGPDGFVISTSTVTMYVTKDVTRA